jgi:hypothetical protein
MNQKIGKLRVRVYRIDNDEVTVECLDGDDLRTTGKPPYTLGGIRMAEEWKETPDDSAGTTNALLSFKAPSAAALGDFIEGRLLTLSFKID